MPTSFTVMVTKSPFDSRNVENAITFCRAAINSGHKINQVFFYQAGVQCASSLLEPNSDEINTRQAWLELHNKHGINLNVCTTAGSRRGVVAIDSSPSTQTFSPNIEAPFTAVGLSAYFEALADGGVNIQL
ncbi:sulfurtransferase complex subunit TusD [Glaciecola sp. 2405UD65-10]|uniref:sulfurtransferase complex subunit TusD n=1 Tax=Glaciecola sp. 2405UD65-10 TaxID=3397244 RepID=UPI003B5BA796